MFKNLFLKLAGFGQSIVSFLAPIAASSAGKLLDQVLPIALGVVADVAKTRDLPNAKRDAAYEQLKGAAVAAGIDAGTSVLNLAIELAVQRLKTDEAAPVGNGR